MIIYDFLSGVSEFSLLNLGDIRHAKFAKTN